MNEPSDYLKYRGLTLKDVEIEHLKTTIICLIEEHKVVEDLHKDVRNKRDKEQCHKEGAADLNNYIDNTLKKQAQEEDDKNRKFEEMLDKDNKDLQMEIQEIMREIERVNKEREEQKRKYEAQIKNKDEIIIGKFLSIVTLWIGFEKSNE
jgi:CHASE3 domain sensor protein